MHGLIKIWAQLFPKIWKNEEGLKPQIETLVQEILPGEEIVHERHIVRQLNVLFFLFPLLFISS